MEQLLASPEQLSRILRTARRRKGQTQFAAASKLDLSQSRLSAMELNAGSITVEQLLNLLSLYGLEVVVRDKDTTVAEW